MRQVSVGSHSTINSRYYEAASFAEYSQTPLLRRIGVVVIVTIIFTPALLIIAATGPVYARRHGQVVRYTWRARVMLMLVSGVLTLSALSQALIR